MKKVLYLSGLLNSINNINDNTECLGQLSPYDYIITTPKGGPNELTYSNILNNTIWTNNSISIQANATLDVFGSSNMWLLTDNSSTSVGNISQSITIINNNNTHVVSFFYKSSTSSVLGISISLTGGTTNVNLGLALDTIANNYSAASTLGSTPIAPPTIISTGINGIYRISIPIVNNNTGNTTLKVSFSPAYASTLAGNGYSFNTLPVVSLLNSVYLSHIQVDNSGVLNIYTDTLSVPVTVNQYISDLQVINSLKEQNSIQIFILKLDLTSYFSTFLVDQISYYYGGLISYVYLNTCDYSNTVNRTIQINAFNYIRGKNYNVAFTSNNPQDTLDYVVSPLYNNTGQSLPIYSNDINIVLNILNNEVWLSKIPVIAYDIVRTNLLRYKSILKICIGSSDNATDYSSLVRSKLWNYLNFFGYTACGFSSDVTYYNGSDRTIIYNQEQSTVLNAGQNVDWYYTDDNTITRSDGPIMSVTSTIDIAVFS